MSIRWKGDHGEMFAYYNALKWDSTFILWLNAANIPVISKNASSKSCTELNLLQKTEWTHISIYSWSGARVLQRFTFLKYYNALKWKKFTLEQNAAKNIDYIEKCFKQKLYRLKFATKSSMDAYLYLSPEWS